MAEIAPNWQSAGPTFHQEIKYVTHLRPKDSPQLRRTGSIVRQGSVRRHYGGGTAPVSEEPLTMGPANLTRTLSRAASFKQRRRSMTPCAKLHHFLERLSWNARVKGYTFDQKYLQRQPSFVVTPDRSSYNFSFKPPDLVKRRPKPQAKRTSRPLAAWKNPQPLEVLANNGQVTNLPEFLTNVDTLRPIDLHISEYSQRESTSTATNTSSVRSRPVSYTPADPVLTLATEEAPRPEDILEDQREKTQSTKITLPVRLKRNSLHSVSAPTDASLSSLSSNLAGPRTSAGASVPPTTGSSSTEGRATRKPRPPPLDLPQTPVPPINDDSSAVNMGSRPKSSASVLNPPREAPEELRNGTSGGFAAVSLRRSNARRVSAPPAHARTIGGGDAPSPTALPSEYRPESWRRSAIIARNSMLEDNYDEEDEETPANLASVWSAYLQRAIAQRAIAKHQRRSAEIRQETRWSRNIVQDTDESSPATRPSSRNEVQGMFRDSTLSLGSASSFSVPPEEYIPLDSEPAASIRSATSSRYASVPLDSPVARPRSITSLKSELGAVHSPRALARASQTELARIRRQSMISDTVISLSERSQPYSPIKTDQSAPTPPPHGSSVTPRRFSQQIADAPQKYVTLFTDSQGDHLQSPWQPEPSLRSATSSSFEGDEYEFPAKHSEIMVRKRPLSTSPQSTHSSTTNAPPAHAPPSRPTSAQPASANYTTNSAATHSTDSSETSTESRRISRLATEPASAIVRQQSQWRRSSGQKRVKSTGSKEVLLHTRQATLESLWGAESSGSE